MANSSGFTLLSAAATALKSGGSGVSINSQIDSVSNALTGVKRVREMTPQANGYPPEAKNVLEILKIQINKALSNLSEQEADEQIYNKLVEDLEIIETFADRIMKFYDPQGQGLPPNDEELKVSVRQSFVKAKTEALTTIALKNIFNKLTTLEDSYRNNPNLTQHEFRVKLEDLSTKVKKWEDELVPSDPVLRDSQTIAEKIYRLKSKLHEAIEVSELQQHPGVLAESGLDLLRVASGMLQQAKSQFEIEQAVMMAQEANRNLKRSGKQFQEKGIPFNLLIQQSIALFVNRQIRTIEQELQAPFYYIEGDVVKNDDLAKRLINQIERLIVYFEFAIRWTGPHQEDLLERIAIVYEKIVDRARNAKQLVLDEASKKGTPQNLAIQLARVAAKFRRAETMARDIIDPKAIFHDKSGVSDEIRTLLELLPEPLSHSDYFMPYSRLGRLYAQILDLRSKPGLDATSLSKISIALTRIEVYAIRQKMEIDIFDEMLVRSEYLKDLEEQEFSRFMVLLGMDPSVTIPARYSSYPNPGEYPFKGAQLAKVVRNHRILGSFLEGRFGGKKNYLSFQNVCHGFYNELELYCAKIKLELLKKLKLSIVKSPKIDEVEIILTSRIEKIPESYQAHIKDLTSNIETKEIFSSLSEEKKKEAKELQALWVMLQYLKFPERMAQLEKIDAMQRDQLIVFSRELIQKAEKNFLQSTLEQIKSELQIDEVLLPLTHEFLDTRGGDHVGKIVVKKFIQLKNPIMKSIEPFSEQLLKSCAEHRMIAERIIQHIIAHNPSMIRKLIVDNITEIIEDAQRVALTLPTSAILSKNQENQFYRDHQVPDLFPLYIEGGGQPRKENESMHDKMLYLAHNNDRFAELIRFLSGHSMFDAALDLVNEKFGVLTGVPESAGFKLKVEDRIQFLTIDKNIDKATLIGYGLLLIFAQTSDPGILEEIGSLIIKIHIEIQNDQAPLAIITFFNHAYNPFISQFREGKTWTPF